MLVEKCVASCVPLLVCEYDTQKWFVCPNCHSVIDREYTAFCNCCGQKLSWYGTMKACRHRKETPRRNEPNYYDEPTNKRQTEKLQAKVSAIRTDIDSLKKQIKKKQSALKCLMEKEEENKRKHLMKILAANGISIEDMIARLNDGTSL